MEHNSTESPLSPESQMLELANWLGFEETAEMKAIRESIQPGEPLADLAVKMAKYQEIVAKIIDETAKTDPELVPEVSLGLMVASLAIYKTAVIPADQYKGQLEEALMEAHNRQWYDIQDEIYTF